MTKTSWFGGGLPFYGAALVAVLIALAGCSSSGNPEGRPRAPISGTVTLDGQPLPYGTINFVSRSDGRNASGSIQNGRYDIPEAQGPNQGTYAVTITGYEKSPAAESESDLGTDMGPQLVPAQYNNDTTLEVEIGAGPNVHDFSLTRN